MNDKRFRLREPTIDDTIGCSEISDNGEWITYGEIVELLNEQDATIERYQFIIKDALSRERTELGQSVLRQLAEALEIEI